MNQDEKLYRLLTDASEDCTPFWDAVWEVALPGDNTDANVRYHAAIPEAQQLMRLLLISGLIRVYRGSGYQSSLGAEGEFEVSVAEASEIIAAPENWRRPSDTENVSEYFCFYATESGKHLWLKGFKGFQLPEGINFVSERDEER